MPKKLKARYKPERQGKHLNINMEYETTVTRTEPIVITIGNFDGVHIGHQRLMHELSAHFNIKGMVVGTNFSLGHNRMGNVAFLQQYGQENNIVVHPISLEEVERTHISSTRIRALVSEGRISDANELLGHPLT